MQDAILQLLIAAAPAVFLYFTGWSFLYFYLERFNINIGEINFDLPTVVIYSYPPLHLLWEFHGTAIIAIVLAVAVAWCFGPGLWQAAGVGWPNVRIAAGATALMTRMRTWPKVVWTLGFLLVVVFIAPFPLKVLTSWAANQAADRVWDGSEPELKPYVEMPASIKLTANSAGLLGAWLPRSAEPKDSAGSSENVARDYATCEARDAFNVIFAAEEHYFLLCRGEKIETAGAVFEVKGREGLVSVRYVNR